MLTKEVSENISVIVTDCNKMIIWVNEMFTKMTGYTLEEVRGKKPSLLQGRNTEKVAIDRIRKSLKNKVAFHDRITNYRKNGEEYTCALTVHPVFDIKGLLSNFIAFEVDHNFIDPNNVPLMKLSSGGKKYLTESEELAIYFNLTDYFRKDKPYLNPNINQIEVAKSINTNVKYLSQVINNQTGKNFRFFVNQFRIQEFQLLISLGGMSNYTLYSLAQSCGFKNKSTFYNAVFNHTGKTPKKISEIYAKPLDC